MRILGIATLAVLTAVTVASPRRQYGHRHAHPVVKREARPDVVVYAPVTIETVIKYVLDGHEISEEDVRAGLANGTLEWGPDENLSTSPRAPAAVATPPPSSAPAPLPTSSPQPPSRKPNPSAAPPKPVQQPSSGAAPQPSNSPQIDPIPKTASQLVDKNGNCASCDIPFPNGKFDCSEFPYGYGAMPINHEGLGGWSGIQKAGYSGSDGYNDIATVPSGSCTDGSCCTPGSFCSYGCPNPYLKLSFPKKQGVTGQSVGGLYCNEQGKLQMADGSLGDTLCGPTSREMTVKVISKLSHSVSICRTDYPGTESMTFPLTLTPGQTGYLANPDVSKYYFWKGMTTSAQYYVNNQGISEADGCTWAQAGDARGNWAPGIIGTSFDDMKAHKGYTSLKQNELNLATKLNYSITFGGDGVVSPCSYKKSTDQYCQGDSCWSVKDDPGRGCTAAVNSGGTLTITLSDD
ncbi:Beta-glucosidase (SUN) [Pleosporales sp. CAS-2024a]